MGLFPLKAVMPIKRRATGMTFDKLRKLKPEVHDVNDWRGRPDPNFHGSGPIDLSANIKRVGNTNQDPALLDLYQKGPLKSPGWDKVCGSCIYYYPDPNLKPHHGRCRAYGFKQVHEELAADDKDNYMEPDGQVYFPHWIGCPTWSPSDRLSRK